MTASPFGDAVANFTNGSVHNEGPYNVYTYQNMFLRGQLDIPGYNNHIVMNGQDFIRSIDDAIIVSDFWLEEIPLWANVTDFRIFDLKKTYNPENNLIEMKRWAWVEYIYARTEYRVLFLNLDKADYPPSVWTYKEPLNVTVVFYNNSYSPKAVVNAEKNNWTLSERYVYEGEYIEHFSKKGYVRKNGKGVRYIEYYNADLWKSSNDTLFSRMDDSVVINTGSFNLSNLTVIAVYPYSYENVSIDYDYTQVDYSPYKTFSPVFFLLVLPISIVYWVAKKNVRRIL